MKTLVIGGTGLVGSQVVKELLKRGADVRACSRKHAASLDPGAEFVSIDLLDPVSVEKALKGVDKLYLLNAVSPDELTQGLIAYNLAKRAGIKHVVYQSVFNADLFKDDPHFAAKAAIESAIREFDVPYTILRPNYFMQNDANLKVALMEHDLYPAPIGNVGVSQVDIRDIAEAAAIVLTSDAHYGKIYNLAGPEVLTGSGTASIWSRLLGREVTYPGENLDEFEKQMSEQMPAWLAFVVRVMFENFLDLGMPAEPGDIETLTRLLGHPPRRYEDFARETLSQWRKAQTQRAA